MSERSELKDQVCEEILLGARNNISHVGTISRVSQIIDEMRKELFECFGSSHWSVKHKRFIKGIADREELVLKLGKWLGERTSSVSRGFLFF